MKKALQLVLLFLPLAAILTISSCHGDDNDNPKSEGFDYTTVILGDNFASDITSLHYEVIVYEYHDFAAPSQYSRKDGTVYTNILEIPHVDIPRSNAFQIGVRLFSNDCSLSCVGSCVTPPYISGGYPEFYESRDFSAVGSTGIMTVHFNPPAIACN